MSATPFATVSEFLALLASPPALNAEAISQAQARNGQLTKPPAALGRLEDLAIWMAGWQGTDRPAINAPQIAIFAGNHGVAAQGVSAFPPEVTAQMVLNFQAGGAAINQLAKLHGARMDVHALRLDEPTEDFTQGPAMDEAALVEALLAGWNAVGADTDLLIVGEMGIGNTTSAAGLATCLGGGQAQVWVGRGTGVEDAGLALKARVIEQGMAVNAELCGSPIGALQALGGREIAAMVGAMAAARLRGIPMLLDGFIASSAALVLHGIDPALIVHMQAAHVSDEQAHGKMLAHLGLDPILDLSMRLGEGSGAGVALGVLTAAVACHSGMSTFADAGVSEG